MSSKLDAIQGRPNFLGIVFFQLGQSQTKHIQNVTVLWRDVKINKPTCLFCWINFVQWRRQIWQHQELKVRELAFKSDKSFTKDWCRTTKYIVYMRRFFVCLVYNGPSNPKFIVSYKMEESIRIQRVIASLCLRTSHPIMICPGCYGETNSMLNSCNLTQPNEISHSYHLAKSTFIWRVIGWVKFK